MITKFGTHCTVGYGKSLSVPLNILPVHLLAQKYKQLGRTTNSNNISYGLPVNILTTLQ